MFEYTRKPIIRRSYSYERDVHIQIDTRFIGDALDAEIPTVYDKCNVD